MISKSLASWRYAPIVVLAGWTIGSGLLSGQDPTSGAAGERRVCMWNDAVCQHGDKVSIGTVATDADMSMLDDLKGVKEIDFIIGPDAIGGPKITDAGFLHIQNLRELEVLEATELPLLTNDSLRGLSNLSHLREVRFEDNHNFTDAGIAHLQRLTALRTVTFYGAPITDHALQYLRASADLEDLQLGGSRITEEGARQIAQFRKLKTLDLQGTQITDKAVFDIATLPNLQWLCLRETAVTDQGLLALRSTTTLRDLYIMPGKFKVETIASLQDSLPELKVHFQ